MAFVRAPLFRSFARSPFGARCRLAFCQFHKIRATKKNGTSLTQDACNVAQRSAFSHDKMTITSCSLRFFFFGRAARAVRDSSNWNILFHEFCDIVIYFSSRAAWGSDHATGHGTLPDVLNFSFSLLWFMTIRMEQTAHRLYSCRPNGNGPSAPRANFEWIISMHSTSAINDDYYYYYLSSTWRAVDELHFKIYFCPSLPCLSANQGIATQMAWD